MRAPVAGVVSGRRVNTIGSVVGPGKEILRIVPADDRLLVEARLRPEDVAYVCADLSAKVKLTALEFINFRTLEGHVRLVGADAETDLQTGETHFPMMIEMSSTELVNAGARHSVRAGIVAQVDIITGERTVLDYLLKTIRKAGYEALRER